ncbi:YdcF family protein [Pedobacter sp. CFBP9032]|uniref:YdcF family protein n=1 Tax=Pedobacter sp. CFBP9032 TaxID=3096539 RepID=UPI002A6A9F97|nr:YdcF family protein [Pedobacter sp. CFBP9032]
MIFILSKILIFILRPIVWVVAIFIVAFFLKKRRKQFLLVGILLFLFFSNSFIVGKITNSYEAEYPKLQHYDVGILLGGYSYYNERAHQIAFGQSSDRLFQTIKLYKEGVIKKILLSSGSANLLDTTVKEADLTIGFLRKLGIPDSVIMIENRSRNTVENAKYSLSMIKKRDLNAKILVITSAWHIPRSRLIFDKISKSKLDYYPTNFVGKTEYELSDFILPEAAAFLKWDMLLKEWVGYIVDSIRS